MAFLCLFGSLPRANAFSLLGPYAPWMTTNLNYHTKWWGPLQLPIGGPMPIGEGYRWNVPVLTYGFDQSFLQYFGPKGAAAVEKAIQMINDLPSASSIVLTNYALDTTRINYSAQGQSLVDLSSVTLSALLNEWGLRPRRRTFGRCDNGIRLPFNGATFLQAAFMSFKKAMSRRQTIMFCKEITIPIRSRLRPMLTARSTIFSSNQPPMHRSHL